MEITARPSERKTRRSYTLLDKIKLRRARKPQIVGTRHNDETNEDRLVGTIRSQRDRPNSLRPLFKGLSMHWTIWDPFGLKGASYTASLKLSADDIGAIVEAATGDSLLAEHVMRKCQTSDDHSWFIQNESEDVAE
jgi:hypothetical protein